MIKKWLAIPRKTERISESNINKQRTQRALIDLPVGLDWGWPFSDLKNVCTACFKTHGLNIRVTT